MQTATVSALQERVRVLCGLPAFTTDTPVATADILDITLSAIRKLYGLVRQHAPDAAYMVAGPTSLTCTANVATVSLPSTASDVLRLVWVKSATEEVNLTLATVDEMVANTDNRWGDLVSPRYRLIGGSSIQLYPAPDSAYTLSIHYATDSSLITSTSSQLSYRESWDDFVVYWSCINVRARQEKDASDFQALFADAKNDVATQLRRDRFGTARARDLRGQQWREVAKKVLPP